MSVLKRYCQAWRMWNSWLVVSERQEIEIEAFIESGFTLIDTIYKTSHIRGRDGHYDVDIFEDSIHISYNEKPRFTWYPFMISYGNLNKHESPISSFDLRPRFEPRKADPGTTE